MAAKQQVLTALRESGVVAVIRTENPADLLSVANALIQGGVKFVEITMTVPGALEVIHGAAAACKYSGGFVGAGTVLDVSTARAAIMSGAAFIVGPAFAPDIAEICHIYDVAYLPGAFTPQKILAAWRGGADVVKVFPADIGGPGYLRTIKGPFPQLELFPTGGIDFETAGAYIAAGAMAIGVGGALVSSAMIAAKEFERITENAVKFIRIVRDAREKGISRPCVKKRQSPGNIR